MLMFVLLSRDALLHSDDEHNGSKPNNRLRPHATSRIKPQQGHHLPDLPRKKEPKEINHGVQDRIKNESPFRERPGDAVVADGETRAAHRPNDAPEEHDSDWESLEEDNHSVSDDQRARREHSSRSSDDERKADDDDVYSRDRSEDLYFQDENAPLADWDYYPKLPQRVQEPNLEELKDGDFDFAACPAFMASVDSSPPPMQTPTHHACDGYDGVLHIQHYDHGGASGVAFFEINIGILQWADQHNYLPWIHLDGYTRPIWDPEVHFHQGPDKVTFTMQKGMEVGWARDVHDITYHTFPGKPVLSEERLTSKVFRVKGTGVWRHYFEPVSDFVPADESCRGKPLVRFSDEHIVPGIHSYAPWAPRAVRHTDAPYLVREDLALDDWFRPQRMHASEIVQRYIRFNPVMEHRAKCSFPDPEFSLGMHIRHGDKYLERHIIKTGVFLKYATAFVENGGKAIYVASDSAKVFEKIATKWPEHVASHVVRQPSVAGLTRNKTAAFDLGVSAHRTNTEALTDLLALSKCTFFIHSLSALSEAVLYMNPGLIERSINLEDRNSRYKTPEYFVNEIMPRGRTKAEK
jgi:hypothetical protein